MNASSPANRRRLLGILAVLLLALVVALACVHLMVRKWEALLDYSAQLREAQESLASIEFGFLFEKDIGYQQRLRALRERHGSVVREQFRAVQRQLTASAPAETPLYADTLALAENLDGYFVEVTRIIELQTRLGLNQDLGHYGALREQAHILEDRLQAAGDDTGLVLLLQLRRHEKDFMLRGKDRYVERFDDGLTELIDQLGKRYPGDREADALLAVVAKYRSEFHEFARLFWELGLGDRHGATQRTALYRQRHEALYSRISAGLSERLGPLYDWQRLLVVALVASLTIAAIFAVRARREVEFARERNPLTDLNGNRRIEIFLKEISDYPTNRVVIYFDFDFFKPFNDHYGFKAGDQTIRAFADMLREDFGQRRHFIGHVGGDDFIVAIHGIDFDSALDRTRRVCERFRAYATRFYTTEEVERGWVQRKDRFGEIRRIPLLSVSAVLVELAPQHRLRSPEDISSAMAVLKDTSKQGGVAAMTLLVALRPH